MDLMNTYRELIIDEFFDKILWFFPVGIDGDETTFCSPFDELIALTNKLLKMISQLFSYIDIHSTRKWS